MPRGFLTEDGKRPEFAEMYGAQEHPSSQYRDRTISNVGLADGTIIFNHRSALSPGTKLAIKACEEINQRYLVVIAYKYAKDDWTFRPWRLRAFEWIRRDKITALNVAGNRESRAKGLGVMVEDYLKDVFFLLKEQP